VKALVVYESLYGNTAAIGEAIAASLRERGMDVVAGPISRIESTAATGTDVLVAGGPTHAHGMSRAGTRRTGASDEKNRFAEPTVEPGLREWLDALLAAAGRTAAPFDTRLNKPRALTGSAAKGIAKRLERRGYRLVAEPESFFVTGKNELEDGEIDHAARWAATVADRVRADAGAPVSR